MVAPSKSDVENGPLKDHGVTVSRTPNTPLVDNLTGDRQDNFGTPVNISIVFENPGIIFEILKQGEQENSTVKAFIKGDVTMNVEDKITWNSIIFRVEDISPQYFSTNLIFKTLTMTLIQPS